MPTAADGFTRDSISERGAATVTAAGAEEGVGTLYHTEDDMQYTAAVYRFASSDAAESGLSHWNESDGSDPKVYVTIDNFALMVFGPDTSTAYTLAGNSPAITETAARETNLINSDQ